MHDMEKNTQVVPFTVSGVPDGTLEKTILPGLVQRIQDIAAAKGTTPKKLVRAILNDNRVYGQLENRVAYLTANGSPDADGASRSFRLETFDLLCQGLAAMEAPAEPEPAQPS